MDKVDDVEEYYDSFSALYDEVAKSEACDAKYFEETRKIFDFFGVTSGTILDVGCGTGLLKEVLGDQFQYTGIDISKNMLAYAGQRGYKTIRSPLQEALPAIAKKSFDHVVCLSTLYYQPDVYHLLSQMQRIARKSILIGLDEVTEEYIQKIPCPVYDHTKTTFPNAGIDYFVSGWTSPSLGLRIRTRMVFFEPELPVDVSVMIRELQNYGKALDKAQSFSL